MNKKEDDLGVKRAEIRDKNFKRAFNCVESMLREQGRTKEQLRTIFAYLLKEDIKSSQFQWIQYINTIDYLKLKFEQLLISASQAPKEEKKQTSEVISEVYSATAQKGYTGIFSDFGRKRPTNSNSANEQQKMLQ